MNIRQESHDKFRLSLHSRKVNRNLPLKGALELTYRCNLKCVHCYAKSDSSGREMDLGEIDRVLKELKAAGCLWLLITGGEPLFRKDFVEIYSRVKEYGFLPIIFTNGTLINEKFAKFLSEYRPLTVEVSLYALGEKLYRTITKVPGAYKRCMDGIGLLIKYKIPFRIKMPLMNLNKNELGKVKEYSESLGVNFRCDGIIHPCLTGSNSPHKFLLSSEEVVETGTRCQDFLENPGESRDNTWLRKKDFFYYSCGAGLNSFSIDPYGKLKTCMLSLYPSYNVLNKGFMNGWKKYFENGKAFELRKKNGKTCLDCDKLFFCDICPGWWKDKLGRDRFLPREYLCKIAEVRYRQAKNKQVNYVDKI